MDRGFRVGRVSQVDYEKGMIRVTYGDMNGADNVTTALIPYIALNNEYHMPNVEDYVAVLHLSNGFEAGLVLGRFWNGKNRPPVSGKDRYRKDLSNEAGKAYIERNPEMQACKVELDFETAVKVEGMLSMQAHQIVLRDNSGSVTLEQIINCIRKQ